MVVEELESRRLLAVNGLTAVYYDNIDFTGKTFQRTDATVNMRVGTGSPVPGVIGPDTFSVRWTGTIEPEFSETYTFYTVSNNGVRLWVNGKKVIDHWVGHATTEDRGTIALAAGKRYDLRMEFFDNTLEATATLSWSSDSVPKQIVPTARLHRYDVRFAVIGDYGLDGPAEAAVANRIKTWTPDFIITTGDNNYYDGSADTIDANIGKHYQEYIGSYKGKYGPGSLKGNRFFPSLGNHDWYQPGARPYLDYFTLPGNERYYDFARGPVHLFALNSDANERDGITSTSTQAEWLEGRLADSTATWQLVYFHHSPFSSGPHGSNTSMQWSFKRWGADAVLTGHDHIYERVRQGGMPYFVNGLGGASRYPVAKQPVAGSQVRFNENFGAMLVQANDKNLTFQFMTVGGTLIDTYTLTAPAAVTSPPDVPAGAAVFAGPLVPSGNQPAVRTTAGKARSTKALLRTPGPRAPAACPCCPRTA